MSDFERSSISLALLDELRSAIHGALRRSVWTVGKSSTPSNADSSSSASVRIASAMIDPSIVGSELAEAVSGQTKGASFATETSNFLQSSFDALSAELLGDWIWQADRGTVSNFDQYAHLGALRDLLRTIPEPEVRTAFDADYIIKPDITVSRTAVSDAELNKYQNLVGDFSVSARRSHVRAANLQPTEPTAFLHASISCKWTLRSDRAQNARTEALNLIRNRKGRAPHIVLVTGEPLPSRIMSIAAGTGDLDCVYHMALDEWMDAVAAVGDETANELVRTLVDGNRIKDVSDLVLDLVL